MRDGLDDARALLPGVRLDHPHTLRSGDRAEVRRAHARRRDAPDTTVIVKTFADSGESWAREVAALSCIPDGAPSARLIAAGARPPIAVMTDAGDGPSVAQALLGDDPAAATEAVLEWAAAIGTLHRATLGVRDAFRTALRARSGELMLGESRMSLMVDEAAAALDELCLRLDVRVPSGALAELRALPRRLGGEVGALSPHDACPDNNTRTAQGLVLVDFEGAQWRHVAWDVAYLTVPWPSCWCSWRMPADVVERAVERYRATVEAELPYVRTARFRDDVTAAGVAWTFVSAARSLPSALGDAPPRDPQRPAPSRRALILHRLRQARGCEQLPALAGLAAALRADLVARWGDVPLGLAPAFAAS
ncbi:MAG TPA: hypothetical protein VH395_15695 [Jatrophihabitantaceae bacterium]